MSRATAAAAAAVLLFWHIEVAQGLVEVMLVVVMVVVRRKLPLVTLDLKKVLM